MYGAALDALGVWGGVAAGHGSCPSGWTHTLLYLRTRSVTLRAGRALFCNARNPRPRATRGLDTHCVKEDDGKPESLCQEDYVGADSRCKGA
jgi:hypothetical protein